MKVVIINRWNDEFSRYDRSIDHRIHDVAYISKADSLTHLPRHLAKQVVTIDDITDQAKLSGALDDCIGVLGGIDRLIALSEFDLINAARLRAQFSIPGIQPDQVTKFRDKVMMKNAILAAGLKAPAYCELDNYAQALAFAQQYSYPIIIKPRAGAASVGVIKIDTGQELENAWTSIDLEDAEVEQYLDGDIYHVDGIADADGIAFCKASRYVNTCLDFSCGQPLGSYVLPDDDFCRALQYFADRCLLALGVVDSAFHLEVIHHRGDFYFLEVGARVGGGEIPFTMTEVHNVDLYQEWIRLQLKGGRSILRDQKQQTQSSGFVLFPELVGKRLVKVDTQFKPAALYASIFPEPGYLFDGNGGYETILARFRFRASSSELVEEAVRSTLENFSYEVS